MNGLKQRIIGALVLVSLAVIFVPMMFDEPHSERETSTIKIPEEPPFPEVDMPDPETTEPPDYRIEEDTAPDTAIEPVAESAPQQESASDDAGLTETPEPVEPVEEDESQAAETQEPSEVADAESAGQSREGEPVSEEFTRSLEGAWVVQLGSFGSNENATGLQKKVREKGYSSHLQTITRGDSQLTRVFSGPFAEKAEAEKAKQALDKAFGLNSLVTSGGK